MLLSQTSFVAKKSLHFYFFLYRIVTEVAVGVKVGNCLKVKWYLGMLAVGGVVRVGRFSCP